MLQLESIQNLPILSIVTAVGPMRFPMAAYRIDPTGLIFYVVYDSETRTADDKANIFVGQASIAFAVGTEFNTELLVELMNKQIAETKPNSAKLEFEIASV